MESEIILVLKELEKAKRTNDLNRIKELEKDLMYL